MAESSSSTFDYVICGGGTAGCALAGRLSENGSNSVLLIEAGGPAESVPASAIPAAVSQVLGTEADWKIYNEQDPKLDGRALHLGRGKFLGGTSGANGTLCIRGNEQDYDDWKMEGWSGKDMFRCMRKAESFKNKTWFEAVEEDHGLDGPLEIAPHDPAEISNRVLESYQSFGLKLEPDMFTSGRAVNGCGHAIRTIHKGVRTTSVSYISDYKDRKNLEVWTSFYVDKIICEERYGVPHAVGVNIINTDGETLLVKATKEIVVSAGTYGSPAVLMRSGIGPKSELDKHAIQIVADLPGVGQNLMDHMVMLCFYEVSGADITNDSKIWHSGGKDKSMEEYKKSKTGFFSQFPFGTFAYARLDERLSDSALWKNAPREEGKDPMGLSPSQPHVEFWNTECYSPKYLYKDFPRNDQHAFALCTEFFGPRSRGSVSLKSTSPMDNPVVDHKYLEHPLDMLVFTEACRMANDIVTKGQGTKDIVKGAWPETYSHHKYTTREEWEPAIRSRADTCYHPAGTCKMGASDDRMSVLDSKLRVRGVVGLRVVDASVMPTLICGHPQFPVYGIAEKAAELILGGK